MKMELLVPETVQLQIIKELYFTGHFATSKIGEIGKRFFLKKVEAVITSCLECILCNKKVENVKDS